MFKYVRFTPFENKYTKVTFTSKDEDVKVHEFDINVVALESEDESLIDEIIAYQDEGINCEVITASDFKELVAKTSQIERIREIVRDKISSKYTFADEIALTKKDLNDAKRKEYESFVSDCIFEGKELKKSLGYF